MIKFWRIDGTNTHSFSGHDSFIYSMVISGDTLVTSGEDCNVKIWNINGDEIRCTQAIPIPAISIWTLTSTSLGDLIIGASDGHLYIFSDTQGAKGLLLDAYEARLKNMQISNPNMSESVPTVGLDALDRSGTILTLPLIIRVEGWTSYCR